jgi:phosphomannomutase
MLGVSGMRGIVGKSLTPDVAARYAGAFATWLRGRTGSRSRRPSVVLGMDGRLGGDVLMHTAAQALRAAGCDVLVAGTAMTPSIGFVVDDAGADGGMVITASHNPQEWNGLKLIVRDPAGKPRKGAVSASAPAAALAAEVINIYRAGEIAWQGVEQVGDYLPGSPMLAEAHEEAVLSLLKDSGDLRRLKRRKFTVALDTVGGAGGVWAGRFLEAIGCEVRELYPVLKHCGRFPHTPEPTRENLVELCRATKRWKADIGLALDPDGDRLAIVDDRGRYIGEEYTLALAAESLLSGRVGAKPGGRTRKGKGGWGGGQPLLVTNLSTSRMLDDVAARHSARVLRTPVGEANVVEVMKREAAAGNDVVVGGEGNGGVIWPRVTYIRDSLSAMGLVLSLMARTGRSVSELVAEMPAYAIDKRKVDLSRREDAQPAIEALAAAYKDEQIDRQDGIRIDFPSRRAWLHVRPSNTEPIMRLIAEAPSSEEAARLLDEASTVALKR